MLSLHSRGGEPARSVPSPKRPEAACPRMALVRAHGTEDQSPLAVHHKQHHWHDIAPHKADPRRSAQPAPHVRAVECKNSVGKWRASHGRAAPVAPWAPPMAPGRLAGRYPTFGWWWADAASRRGRDHSWRRSRGFHTRVRLSALRRLQSEEGGCRRGIPSVPTGGRVDERGGAVQAHALPCEPKKFKATSRDRAAPEGAAEDEAVVGISGSGARAGAGATEVELPRQSTSRTSGVSAPQAGLPAPCAPKGAGEGVSTPRTVVVAGDPKHKWLKNSSGGRKTVKTYEVGDAGSVAGLVFAIHNVLATCASAACQSRFKVWLSAGCMNPSCLGGSCCACVIVRGVIVCTATMFARVCHWVSGCIVGSGTVC